MRAITSDHTYVANLVQLGQISIQEALHHPQRHVITNAIGIWKAIEVDIFDVEESVQSVLLCSDGLHGYVDERLINNVLKDQRLHIHTKTQRLVQAANDAGGYDNVTVIVVDLNGGESHDE
jgi:protein phosphatase